MESLSERTSTGYQQIHDGIIHLVDSARTETVRSVNALMTATYWEIGRRIVEFEQGGEARCNQVNHLIPTRVLVKGGEITCKILK